MPLVNIFRSAREVFWEIIGTLRPSAWSGSRPVVVTFTGGMGAQIISAAIYFLLKQEGRKVFADMSYFEKSAHIATEGTAGDISHWDWQLHSFSLFPESFDAMQKLHRSRYKIIKDGENKSSLGIKALSNESIRQKFTDKESMKDILPERFLPNYLCIHVRRGDYVNVASYLVDDEDFLELANKISGLVDSVVIVSDSMIPDAFREQICGVFKNALFLDNVDAVTTHRVMRNARVLICSNSQFSLVAALLNRRALVFLPKKWFGNKSQKKLTEPLNALCDFQVLKSD